MISNIDMYYSSIPCHFVLSECINMINLNKITSSQLSESIRQPPLMDVFNTDGLSNCAVPDAVTHIIKQRVYLTKIQNRAANSLLCQSRRIQKNSQHGAQSDLNINIININKYLHKYLSSHRSTTLACSYFFGYGLSVSTLL